MSSAPDALSHNKNICFYVEKENKERVTKYIQKQETPQ